MGVHRLCTRFSSCRQLLPVLGVGPPCAFCTFRTYVCSYMVPTCLAACIFMVSVPSLCVTPQVGTPLAARILRTHIVPLPLASSRLATATLPTLSDLDTLDVTLNK